MVALGPVVFSIPMDFVPVAILNTPMDFVPVVVVLNTPMDFVPVVSPRHLLRPAWGGPHHVLSH